MPPIRNSESASTQNKKHLSESDRFANALGLDGNLKTFHECKKVFRRLADRTFNFDLPLFQQQAAMEVFVQKVVSGFPGFFDEKHENNRERLKCLQHYAYSYLTKSGKMTTGTGGKKKRKGKPDILSPQAPPGPPAKLDIIKVDRPRPKPLYRGKTTSTTVDTPMPAAPPLETSSQNYTLAPVQGSPRTVKKPDYTTRHTKQRDTPKKALPSLYKFLAKCDPPMEHLAAGFKDAGFKDGMDLVGMAKWKDERQRKFLSDTTKIARTALEVEAIVIGLSGLLLESSLVISAAN